MTKYVNDNGVSEMWTNTKNYIASQLLGKSDVGHTHSASDITSGLATVATSGSYNDLSNKPTIPSKTSDLTNDSGFITSDNTKIPLAGSNQISGSLIPATTVVYDLGSSSYQWNNAYIKSLTINGVACGDILTHNVSEFVNLTGAQTIAGVKTFSKITLKSSRIERGALPSSNIEDNEIEILDKNDRRILGIFNYYYTSGNGRTNFYAYNPNTTDYDNIAISFNFDNTNNQKSLIPSVTNLINLGTSTYKWKSLNGIAPDELGLPTSTYTDVSSYITHFNSTPNTFTAPVSGLFFIEGTSTSIRECAIFNNTKGYVINLPYAYYNLRGLFPVEKGDSISVCINDSLNNVIAQIFRLKGKV